VACLTPAATSLIDTVAHEVQIFDPVGVGADHQPHTGFMYGPCLDVIEVQPLRLGVDLERHSMVGGRLHDLVEIDLVGLPVLDDIAHARRTSVPAVALAWLCAQPTVVAPIASARTVTQLSELLPVTGVNLTHDEVARLSAASSGTD